MAFNQYLNVDGEVNLKSPWISKAHGVFYRDLEYPDGYHLSYTRVVREIPSLSGYAGPLTEAQYWKTAPLMYAKLGIHRTFLTKVAYYEPSLEVFLNGIPLPSAHITHLGTGRFQVSASVPDGILSVAYVPQSPSLCVGDQRTTLDGPKCMSEFVAPEIDAADVVRCRKAINGLQVQTGYLPSNWIGGPFNTIKSRATNLVKGVTGVFGEHVREMQDALSLLAYHVDSLSSHYVPKPTFTEVVNGEPFGVQYLEEIRYSINELEYFVIDLAQ